MFTCQMLDNCTFFKANMPHMPFTATILKLRYCTGANARCARYLASRHLGIEKVPLDLLPNQLDRLHELVCDNPDPI